MRQLAVQRGFFEPAQDFALHAEAGAVDLNQLLMLALERALAPPIVHRRSTLQPMRVVIVDRELISRLDPTGGAGASKRVLPSAIQHAAQISSHMGYPLQQRAVRGEILSDEGGRLYEKLGRQIRPLHQLASGPCGEVLDLVPAPETPKPAETGVAQDESATSPFLPVTEATKPAGAASQRKLFADPGQWRVLSWGDFKEILAPQLAHPERLRDSYRLPCYVQVLEMERSVSLSELAGVYKSDGGRRANLYFLTEEIAAKLDLVLPLRAAPPQNAPRPPNTLLAHERVFRLIVANDPTTDIANTRSTPEKTFKETIPTRFIKEWEFKISRDEALYDMNAPSSIAESIRKFCRRLRVGKRRSEFKKWQALLVGKEIDEQLWAVRPPQDSLRDLRVRDWAGKSLELGGYEASRMIHEWEIFWRRRGL